MNVLTLGLKMDFEGLNPNLVPRFIAVNMGYAARMVDMERRSDLSEWSEVEIVELAARDEQGHIDLEAIEDGGPRSEKIRAWVVSQTDDLDSFFKNASCMPALWHGLTCWGAMQLHKNMRRQHFGSIRDLDASWIGGLMRLGYVLRCVDEALGRGTWRPKDLRQLSPSPPSESLTVPPQGPKPGPGFVFLGCARHNLANRHRTATNQPLT
jgi:hypothetical protein